MKEKQPILDKLDGARRSIVIPPFQRNFNWQIKHCEELLHSILRLCMTRSGSVFLGIIVTRVELGTGATYVIDGQQRLMTISLVLAAIIYAYEDGRISCSNKLLIEQIRDCYLFDRYSLDERKLRLRPMKADMAAYDAIMCKHEIIISSNVSKNYLFLYEQVCTCGLTVDELFEAIGRLTVVDLMLDEDDDPQSIFETINSTGLSLTEGDKIRNFLFTDLTASQMEDFYNTLWVPLEECTNYELTSFVRDYLTMKQGRITKIGELYPEFKQYAEGQGLSRRDLLHDMLRYAKIHRKINRSDTGIPKLDRKIKEMMPLEFRVAYPFLISFFDYAMGKLDDGEIHDVFDLVENYWARRLICGIPTNALNHVFATLHRDVIRQIERFREQSPEGTALPTYLEVLKYTLLLKSGAAEFPDDEQVRASLATREVYRMSKRPRAFLIERFENRKSREKHDVINDIEQKLVSIEHIMPQTLSEEWKADLGADYERIHSRYLDTMANLTLTGYNQAYSNLRFSDKRDMDNGFKDSTYRLNSYLKTCDKWTESELLERQQELTRVFFDLWPMPQSSFSPVQREYDRASLSDEDVDFTGRKIQAYYLYGTRYPCPTWKDMLIQVCEHLNVRFHSVMQWACAAEKYNLHSVNADNRSEFAPGMYVSTEKKHTEEKLACLRGLFSECNIDLAELVFEFAPEKEEQVQ